MSFSGSSKIKYCCCCIAPSPSEILKAVCGIVNTVPVKCKLTVTRNSNDSTRTSILETRKLRVSSLESSHSSFESSCSSFESSRSSFESRRQRIYRSINFSKCMYISIFRFTFGDKFSSRDSRGGILSYSTFVNRLAYLNRLFCLLVELLSFRFGVNYRSFQANNRVTVR